MEIAFEKEKPFISQEEIKEAKITNLRFEREPLLKAFDIYKTNTWYGLEKDANHEAIVQWYNKVLNFEDLETAEEAINNPPDEIKKYL